MHKPRREKRPEVSDTMVGMGSSLAPALLISVPQMEDPNFDHTVTLLVEANQEGAFGLVLNRVSPIKVTDICAENNVVCTRDAFVRVGGPIEQSRAWVLHGPATHDETSYRVHEQILLTPTWEMLARLAGGQVDEKFQVYLGYAGWGPGQLESEIAEGAWLITELNPKFVFDTATGDLWREVLRDMGLDPGKIAPGGGGVN